jgi:predicted nucleic acid-binding protein
MPAGEHALGYFDTSALVKCYVRERGSAAALDAFERHAVVSSALARVEMSSALRRHRSTAAPGVVTAVAQRVRLERAQWRLLALDDAVIARAEQIAAAEDVRALDALHLAAALVFREATGLQLSFVTADDRQRRAAVALGLEVVFVE